MFKASKVGSGSKIPVQAAGRLVERTRKTLFKSLITFRGEIGRFWGTKLERRKGVVGG